MNGFWAVFYRLRAKRLRAVAGRLLNRAGDKYGQARALDARADAMERPVRRAGGLSAPERRP